MSSDHASKKIYQTHRDHQLGRILEAAEMLFIQDGIDNVSISAIARKARMSRKTIYQYYPDKQEIAWAIFQKIIEQWSVSRTTQPEASGHQQLEQFLTAVVDHFETIRKHLRFIDELNTLYAREASADRMRQMIDQASAGGVDWIIHLVRQGITDGSIEAETDPELAAAALLNLLSGMNARFALLGDLITQEYGLPMLAIYQEICRVYLRGIQANP
jgi:AcrR family transcriptional regulator